MEPAIKPASQPNNAGFTLIEVMVSIILLMVGMLGLLEALNMASHQVLRNGLRSEAVKLAENQMVDLKIRPYYTISSAYPFLSISSRIRGGAGKYRVSRNSREISTDISKELLVRVSWKYRNMSTFHEVRTIRTFDDSKDKP